MPTHGADTTIPPDVRLILMDCFETLVSYSERGYSVRRGIPTFLRHFHARAVPVAVISDATEHAVRAALEQTDLLRWVDRILAPATTLLPDGRVRKRLDTAIAVYQVEGSQAVYIGDSPLDALAALEQGVPFIRVPRSEDITFSFESLITGPSRYHSADFAAVLRRRYQSDSP